MGMNIVGWGQNACLRLNSCCAELLIDVKGAGFRRTVRMGPTKTIHQLRKAVHRECPMFRQSSLLFYVYANYILPFTTLSH